MQPSSVSHLLQTEDEGLGTENLVRLSGFTQSLLDDVAIIIIILRQRSKTVKNMQFSTIYLNEVSHPKHLRLHLFV